MMTIASSVTLRDIAELADKLHPDKLFQLINSLDNADMVIRHNGQEMTMRNFNVQVTISPGRATYSQDGLTTVVDSSFMEDPRFIEAYNVGYAAGSWDKHIHWRQYNACWVANRAIGLEGDFVECGVNRGSSALTAMTYTDFPSTGKTFWLMDTFEGIPMDLVTEEERQIGIGTLYNDYGECYEQVVERFKDYDCVKIIRGRIPDTLPEMTAEKICYLYIDMNNATPEIAAAEYYWDRLVSGAIMILDDYAWRTHPVQKREFDKFADRKGVQVLSMPTGQGFILKP
jgi:O-methyltransferase